MFEVIQPELGSPFNPAEHEGYDEEGGKYMFDKRSKKKVFWVTRRGFRYSEKSPDETRAMTVKAIVIVR
jgi:hypothetical protein